jgi:beta-glucanase (GH16 family)
MNSSQPYARWTRAWRVVALLLVVALTPCVVVGSRLAEAVTNANAPTGTNASASSSAKSRPKVVFRDDFRGNRLDAKKWNPSWFGHGASPSNPVNSKENDCYSPQEVMLRRGYLILAAVPHNCLGHGYMAGLVNTNGKFSFVTGVLKARVWLPPGQGATVDWPAIWTDGQHWPNDGEIDVLEGLAGHDCWHVHTVKPTVGACASIKGGWHTVEMDRTKTSLTFFYDGKKVGTASTSAFADRPHYLVLNLAVSRYISPPEKPAFMLVDWIQVTK